MYYNTDDILDILLHKCLLASNECPLKGWGFWQLYIESFVGQTIIWISGDSSPDPIESTQHIILDARAQWLVCLYQIST